MKKTLFFSTAVLAVSLLESQASILYKDSFDTYTDGNLVGQGVWAAHSGAGNKPVQVSGGAITLQQSSGSGEDVNADVGATIGAGDTWYYAFDVSVSGSSNSIYFAHFLQGSTSFEGRLFVTPPNAPGDDYTFGLSGTSSTVQTTWGTDLTYGSTHRVVVSYDYDTMGVSLWVDPADQSSTSISDTGSFQDAVTAIAFRQTSPGDTGSQVIDNLVVATTFTEALTGVPEPSTLALAALGGFALLGFGLKRRK